MIDTQEILKCPGKGKKKKLTDLQKIFQITEAAVRSYIQISLSEKSKKTPWKNLWWSRFSNKKTPLWIFS